ncbi:unnamed protein product [Cylindrotheca closterium]|uniref:Uncharacterized protein n=1 Tax=Cylindrotheca closterium TaxID=2856 RepID=A0AAD2FHB5_9STRA|nr:unnamed protein product [Cylindrotheca closterium]
MTQQNQKRDSQGGDGGRKKRKSYSLVAQAWLETLSEAIEDVVVNNDDFSTISTSSSSPQRRTRPRRNAFVLHITDDGLFLEDEADDSPQQPPPESLHGCSEIENLELG